MTSLTEMISSGNATLQNQALNDVVFRLRRSLHSAISVILNIKDLIVSMAKYGRNDREQIRFRKNISLAVSGEISYAQLMETTGLFKRIIAHSRKIRIAFEVETAKSKAEEAVKDSSSNQPELANIV